MPDNRSPIAVLTEETVNQIAAGEVVDRPASILKELMENAIDSGSDWITVEVTTAKKEIDRIRVVDNGIGIPADQVATAFLPHATSKIRTGDDLNRCLTLGFRGEALPSIAAIATVTMVTRPPEENNGTRFVISGGEVLEQGDIGAPAGTSVTVTDIFHTTPARRKFLKSLQTELSHLTKTIEIFALLRPDVTFRYLVNGQEKISTHGARNLFDVIRMIYGDEAGGLIAVDGEEAGIHVSGYVSKPSLTRQNTQRITLSVNGRVINSIRIIHAIRRGYGTLLPSNLYPVAILMINLDPAFVDANIHPTKREVRFSDENRVFKVISDLVFRALRLTDLTFEPDVEDYQAHSATFSLNDDSSSIRLIQDEPMRYSSSPAGTARQVCEATLSGYRTTARQLFQTRLQEPADREVPHENFENLTYIGQVAATYLVVQDEDGGLVLIDQHAAHERVRYDQLKSEHETGVNTQELLIPVVLNLTPSESSRLPDIIPVLEGEGFIIESFGKDTWCVRGVPVILGRCEDPEAVREILAAALSGSDPDRISEQVMKMASCRGAVKAGALLTPEQGEEIIRQLGMTKEPYTCPHGRPTVVTFSREHLEKLFRRT